MKQLEQILENIKPTKYQTIDMYALGTVALYTAPAPNFNFPLAYNDSAPSPFERQTSLYDYGMPPLPEFKLPEIPKIETEPKGLLNKEQFQFGYDLPGTGTQFHFHGLDNDHLSYGKLKDYNGNTLFEEKNSFNLAMNDYWFKESGFNKFP